MFGVCFSVCFCFIIQTVRKNFGFVYQWKNVVLCVKLSRYLFFLSYCLRFVFFFPEQLDVEIYVTNTQISVGTSYISVSCDLNDIQWIFWDIRNYIKIELFLQCRQNKTNDWQTIVKVSDSGSFITNISKDIETHLEKNETCGNRNGKGCRIDANISIHLESCNGYLDPSFRCQLFNIEKGNTVSSKKVQVEITSKWDKTC